MTLKQQIQYQFKCSQADFTLNVFMMIHETMIHVLQGEKLFLIVFIAFYSMIVINFALLCPLILSLHLSIWRRFIHFSGGFFRV